MSGRVECIRRRFENVEKASTKDTAIPTRNLGNGTSYTTSILTTSTGVRRSPAFRGVVDAKKEAARTLITQKLSKHVQAVQQTAPPPPPPTNHKNSLPAKKNSIVTIPNITNTPNIPNTPKITNTSNIPNTPKITNTPNIPNTPKITNTPKISNTTTTSPIQKNKPINKNLNNKPESVAKKVNLIESTNRPIDYPIKQSRNGYKNKTNTTSTTTSEIKLISKDLIHKFENQNSKEIKKNESNNHLNNLDFQNRSNPDGKESNFETDYFEKHSEDNSDNLTLNEFLNSPLPTGPPPRKPPRTFTHMASGADPKKKLQKLEVALKNRSKGRIILPRREMPYDLPLMGKPSQNKEMLSNKEEIRQNIDKTTDELKNCFECLGGNHLKCDVHVYDGIPHGQSEFFIPTKWPPEHIYAEPFKSTENTSSIEPTQLHYMSTPIENVKKIDIPTPPLDTSPSSPIEPFSIKTIRLNKNNSINNNSYNNEDSSLDRAKIQLLMNQAFGAPLHEPQLNPAVLDDVLTDNERSSTNSENVNETATPFDESAISQLTLQRKTYVRHMSSQCNLAVAGSPSEKLFRRASLSATRFRKNFIFEVILLIGLNLEKDQTNTKLPYLKTKYPKNAQVPHFIEHLVFPEASQWPLIAGKQIDQTYTVVITDESGARKYGYCRRVLPENGTTCLPLAYCLITSHKANGFYHKILTELELRHGQSEHIKENFMNQLYKCEFPQTGNSISIDINSSPTENNISTPYEFIIKRPIDSRMEDRDLSELFNTVSVPVIIQLFSSLLLERKLILLSSSVSLLSSCIEGLQTLLFPFVWVHTVVPILPESMLELVHAPTPYLLGILKQFNLPEFEIDQGLIVDLDTGQIITCVGDESTILPARIRRCLKSALQLVEAATLMEPLAHHVLISEGFIRSWVELCGHYDTHIVTQQDSRRVFERESFIKAAHSRSFQYFLEWFTETAMFSNFITLKLEQTETNGLFEQRILEHSEEMEKNTALFMKNYRVINKKVKTLSDRLKDWTTFS